MPQCQFLFSAVFVFQKSCTGNILGTGRNKSRSSYFHVTKTESEGESKKRHEAASPALAAGPGLATPRGGVAASRLFFDSLQVSGFVTVKIGTSVFVSSNSENISCTTFLKYKKQQKTGTGTAASCQ